MRIQKGQEIAILQSTVDTLWLFFQQAYSL